MDVYQRRRLVALSILAGIFVVVVLLIRSCGDDETAVTPTSGATGATGVGGPTTLSQNDFIDQGDAACLETNTALAAVDDSDPEVAATERGQILAGELDALQTLPPPTDGENKIENFLAALQDQVAAYDRYITALERGDDTAAAELEQEIDAAAREARRGRQALRVRGVRRPRRGRRIDRRRGDGHGVHGGGCAHRGAHRNHPGRAGRARRPGTHHPGARPRAGARARAAGRGRWRVA